MQISKQTQRKKREQQQQQKIHQRKRQRHFFSSSSLSLSLTLWVFFSLPHIYNILMTQTVLGLWYSDRISLLFSLSKYVCDTIIIYIIILGKEKKRSESERVAYKNVDKYF